MGTSAQGAMSMNAVKIIFLLVPISSKFLGWCNGVRIWNEGGPRFGLESQPKISMPAAVSMLNLGEIC